MWTIFDNIEENWHLAGNPSQDSSVASISAWYRVQILARDDFSENKYEKRKVWS